MPLTEGSKYAGESSTHPILRTTYVEDAKKNKIAFELPAKYKITKVLGQGAYGVRFVNIITKI